MKFPVAYFDKVNSRAGKITTVNKESWVTVKQK